MNSIARRARRLVTANAGQALAEMALILPMFALVLFGAIDFGRFAYVAILLGNGAHAGVQYGSLNVSTAADSSGMQSAALTDAQSIAGASASASSYCTCADGSPASCTDPTVCAANHRLTFVSVTASGTFSPWVSFPGIPASIALSRTAVMQVSP